jgi:hypothetical protein
VKVLGANLVRWQTYDHGISEKPFGEAHGRPSSLSEVKGSISNSLQLAIPTVLSRPSPS